MGLYPLLKRNIQNWIYGEDEGHSGSSGPFRPYTINFLSKNAPYHKKESQIEYYTFLSSPHWGTLGRIF